MSIRFKILSAFICTTLLTISIIAGIVFKNFRDYAVQSFQLEATGQLSRIDDIIAIHLGNAKSAVGYMQNLPELRNGLGAFKNIAQSSEDVFFDPTTTDTNMLTMFNIFERIQQINPAFQYLYAGFEDGSFITLPGPTLPAGYDPTSKDWYKIAMGSPEEISFMQPYWSTGNVFAISIMGKIRNDKNEAVGVAAVDFKLATLTESLSNISFGSSGYVIVIDANGMVLVNNKNADQIGKNISELDNTLLTKGFEMESGLFEDNIEGNAHFIQVYTSTTTKWTILAVRSAQDVLAQGISSSVNVLLVGLAILLVACFLAFFISRSIANPITKLILASGEIAKGNFDALPDGRQFKAELGSLYHSLKSMVENLRKLIATSTMKTEEAENQKQKADIALKDAKQAEERANQARKEGMLQAATQLEEVVQAIASLSDEMNLILENIKTALHEQLAISAETASAMEIMNSSVNVVAQNTHEASANAAQVKERTHVGIGNIQAVVQSVEHVKQNTGVVRSSLDALGAQANSIGEIMNIISDIADQTNLLALNAAIEAARAGEAGRGFAVVADEVRKLAEKTMQATTEVGKSVKGIQSGTQQSLVNMENAEQAVTSTISNVKEAEESLELINSSTEKTSAQITSIAESTEKQSATSEHVTARSNQLNHMVTGNSKQIEHCTMLMGKMKDNAYRLANLVNQLQNN